MPEHNESLLFRTGDPDFMTSLARGLEVLRSFIDGEGGLAARTICERTGLSRAVVRRCLYTLVEAGYVRRVGERFVLEPRVLSLAQPYLTAARSLPAIAQPFLESLSDEIQESCSMAVLDGDDVVYVARAATKRIMTVSLTIGSRLSGNYTSLGRVLLSVMSTKQLQDYLDRNPLTAHTPKSITGKRAWRKAIAAVHQQGYAIVDEELEIGLRSLAVPVFGARSDMLAAMNVGVQAMRVSVNDLRTRILPKLQLAAAKIEGRIAEIGCTD